MDTRLLLWLYQVLMYDLNPRYKQNAYFTVTIVISIPRIRYIESPPIKYMRRLEKLCIKTFIFGQGETRFLKRYFLSAVIGAGSKTRFAGFRFRKAWLLCY